MLAALAFLLVQTAADTPPDTSEIEQAEAEQREAQEQADAAQAEADELAREIAALQSRLVAAADRAGNQERAALAAEEELEGLAEEEARILERLLADREALIDVLAALQRIERGSPPALAVAPEDAEDAARAASLLGDIAPALNARAQSLAAELERLRDVRARVGEQQVELASAESRLASEQAEITDLIAERRRLEARRRGEAERLADVAASAGARAENLRSLLATIRSMSEIVPRFNPRRLIDADALPDPVLRPEDGLVIARAAMAPIETLRFADSRGQLRPPVEGRITRRFRQPDESGEPSDGILIRARARGQVIAPFDARIEYAGPFGNYNGLLILNVGDEYYIVLAGLASVFAEAGQSVLAGEPVGMMPDSSETAPDLYLEIRRREQAVDPEPWLRTSSRPG